MKKNFFILFILFIVQNSYSQNKLIKEQALIEFKKEHYNEAIALLEEELKLTPNDAEIYYYLGWFNHYRAYDSRPLKGYNFSYSEQIFKYFDKALELNPNYGDAKYFYGAECSGNAFIAMQEFNLKKLKYYYKLAFNKGAYPNWLKEFGRNFLNSCEQNAILFTGGNADFDVCSYLQLHEKVRTDITLIPIGNIDRPWYVQFLKKGLKNAIKKIEINLTNQQIMDIHPFKWDTTTIYLQVSPTDKKYFSIPDYYKMKWLVLPDLFSERMHSKIESEKLRKRSYLSPQRAILVQIIEDNFSVRPIYFSNFCSPTLYGDINLYFQNCGLVSRLTPIITKNTEFAFNYKKMEEILKEQNIENFKSIKNDNLPRISGMIVSGYYNAVINLLDNYIKSSNQNSVEQLRQKFEKQLKIGFDLEFESEIQNKIENSNNN